MVQGFLCIPCKHVEKPRGREYRFQRVGLFRYDVTACEIKGYTGKHGFIAQRNERRHLKKRPREFLVDQVLQPYLNIELTINQEVSSKLTQVNPAVLWEMSGQSHGIKEERRLRRSLGGEGMESSKLKSLYQRRGSKKKFTP
ncbi:GDP-L-galactose/GDP-D-glucose phosphorylase protein [Raphanus sativus]|nr:GDP-L-galactose/GDP-D-glucose phosphorylase protein [Raphanus sativus]